MKGRASDKEKVSERGREMLRGREGEMKIERGGELERKREEMKDDRKRADQADQQTSHFTSFQNPLVPCFSSSPNSQRVKDHGRFP